MPETRILDLAPLLGARFRERLAGIHDDLSALYARQATGRIVGYAVYLIGLAGAVVWVAARARAGTIDLAGLATFTLAGVRLRTAVSDLAAGDRRRARRVALPHLPHRVPRASALDRERPPAARSDATPPARAGDATAPRIELDQVAFTYPGADRPRSTTSSLSIDAGSVVALVGHNGSGKTTLAKLLARLYEPAPGRS